MAAVGGGVQSLLLVGEDGAVGAGVGRAQQHEASLDLVGVQDVLANQLHVAGLDAPGTGATGTWGWANAGTRDVVGGMVWEGRVSQAPETARNYYAS